MQKRQDDAIAYAEYLEKIAELVRSVKACHAGDYPASINGPGRKALYDNLGQDERKALTIDQVIRETAQVDWRGACSRLSR